MVRELKALKVKERRRRGLSVSSGRVEKRISRKVFIRSAIKQHRYQTRNDELGVINERDSPSRGRKEEVELTESLETVSHPYAQWTVSG